MPEKVSLKIIVFTAMKNCSISRGRVFVMKHVYELLDEKRELILSLSDYLLFGDSASAYYS